MWFAYYIIGSVLFFSFLFYSVNGWKRSIRDILYLFFTFFPLLLFSSLRYPKYGTDTYVYSDMFGVFAHGNYAFYENPYTYEAGFMLLSKIISLMTSNFQMFLLALNLFYIWSCVCFIRKYSSSVWLSVFLFVGMGFFDQSMNVLRQFFALSIILCAYRYLDRRVIGKFLLLVIFASLFHLSSIIFIVMIWIDRIPLNRKVFLGYLAILLISFAFSGKILQFVLMEFGVYGQYLMSSDFGIVEESKLASVLHLFVDIAVLCFCFWGWGNVAVRTRGNILMVKLLMVSSIFWALATNLGVLGRITAYFDIFAIVLLPNVLFSLGNNTNKLISVIMIVSLFVMKYFVISYLRPEWFGIYPYHFYFEYL